MKLYKKLVLAFAVVIATSCTIDLREDPNAVQPNQVLPSLMLNSMQRSLAALFSNASGTGMALTRMTNSGSSLYNRSITPEGFNGLWSNAYASILSDADLLMDLCVPDKTKPDERYARHMGITRIIQAYTLILLVDSFGDVPFSEAFAGSANFNPGVDTGADLYDLAIQLLDSAKIDLSTNTTTSNPPGYHLAIAPDLFDLYYGLGPATGTTSFTKWIKLANTLKLKIYLNRRVESAASATASAAAIEAMITEPAPLGGFITAQNENFVFRYATNASDPDSRHPNFANQYPSGGGTYQSNWLIWHMFHGYDQTNTTTAGTAAGDPRIRFYMARQTTANSTNTNELRCLSESAPTHYPASTGTAIIDNLKSGRPPLGVSASHPTNDAADIAWDRTFCVPTDRGYWGRDHVDPQGIPPDNFLRTAWGPYPSGGRFDSNNSGGVTTGQGQRGAGIQPIMTRSFVNFMLAEAALYMTIPSAALPRTYYINGITQSFQEVRDWSVLGTYGTNSTAASAGEGTTINTFYTVGNWNTDVGNYITAATAAYDQSLAGTANILPNNGPVDEAMNYVAREFWIALYGNGVEAYNLYRRTGMPSGQQPALTSDPGPYPVSFWYPANFANLNSAVAQKPDLTIKVFWDKTTLDLNF